MPRLRSQQFFLCKICGETFYSRRQVDAHPDGHQRGDRKPTEASVTEFCYKSLNFSLRELKRHENNTFSNTRTVQKANFAELSHFFNQHDSSLGRHVNAASRKSLEIQAQSITKPAIAKCAFNSPIICF